MKVLKTQIGVSIPNNDRTNCCRVHTIAKSKPCQHNNHIRVYKMISIIRIALTIRVFTKLTFIVDYSWKGLRLYESRPCKML
jgi:hypothetical protein